MKVLLSICLLLPLWSNAKEGGIKSLPDYLIVLDSSASYVEDGKCLLEITLHRRSEIENQSEELSFSGLELKKQDLNQNPVLMHTFGSEGTYRASISPQKKYLQIHDPKMMAYDTGGLSNETLPLGFMSVYTQEIEFKAGHHIKIEVYLYSGMPIISDKPIIYLYPEKEQEVEVKLFPKGDFRFTYPEYKDSWKYTVTPEGLIKDGDKQYYYLFWEGNHSNQLLKDSDKETGFVVKGSKTQEFFEEVLPKMGLTPTEYNEFIVYWTPLMQHNRYNFIHFFFDETYSERVANIEVTPKPDSMFRLFMVYEPLLSHKEIIPQKLPQFKREGFALIEWGGSQYNNLQSH